MLEFMKSFSELQNPPPRVVTAGVLYPMFFTTQLVVFCGLILEPKVDVELEEAAEGKTTSKDATKLVAVMAVQHL